MSERFSFNINAELFENDFGELAVRIPGEKTFRVEKEGEAFFPQDAAQAVLHGQMPSGWQEMTPRELLTGRGWHCIGRLGFIDGDETRPAMEMEVEEGDLGPRARAYLSRLLH